MTMKWTMNNGGTGGAKTPRLYLGEFPNMVEIRVLGDTGNWKFNVRKCSGTLRANAPFYTSEAYYYRDGAKDGAEQWVTDMILASSLSGE